MEIITVKNVNAYIKNDIAYLKLADVARGLGITQLKNGIEYIRWDRLKEYLKDFNFPTSGENDFIPENIFYKLCMKANNDVARKFQDLVAEEILPSIRKHGAYMTEDTLQKALTSPDFLIQLATNLKLEQEKNAKLIGEIQIKQQLIEELKPIKEYVDVILSSNESLAVTQIAADYGLSATKLNSILQEERIQRKVNGQWILYLDHQSKGYTKSETVNIGNDRTRLQTKWTQKGRLKIHEILTKLGYKANADLQNIT